MEDFAGLLAALVIVAVSMVLKMKKQTARSAQQSGQREAEEKQRIPMKKESAAAAAFAAAPAPARMSGEGRDDCHAYMLDDAAPVSAADEKTDEEKQQTANDLVRGVIMGEILRRPRMGYGRKSL